MQSKAQDESAAADTNGVPKPAGAVQKADDTVTAADGATGPDAASNAPDADIEEQIERELEEHDMDVNEDDYLRTIKDN